MTCPIQPSAALSPRQSCFSLRNIVARRSAVALEIIAMIVLVIAAFLAVLPWARAATMRADVAPAAMSAPLLRAERGRVAAPSVVQTLPCPALGPMT